MDFIIVSLWKIECVIAENKGTAEHISDWLGFPFA